MHDYRFIFKSFSLFFKYKPIKLIFLFFITLFIGFSQGISIVLLIPLLELISPDQNKTSHNKWTESLNSIFNHIGIGVNLELILVLFAICLLMVAVFNYYQAIMQAAYQQEFSYQSRKRLFKKIINSDWTFLNGKSKHDYVQVLTTEIPKMTTYYYFYLGLATKIIFILSFISIALMLSIKFTLFIVFMGLIVFIFLRKYLIKAAILGDGNIQAFRKMLKHIDDFWLTVKMAKVHNSEEFYYKKFDESNTLMLNLQYKQLKNRAVPQFLFTIAGILSLIVVVYIAYRIVQIPLTSLFVLILLFARIFPQFVGINNDMNMIVSLVESVKMVLALDMEIPDRDFEKKITMGKIEFNHKLEIKNLNFAYDPNNPIFINFSETISANKITGIIGKTGCGKTTFIDIIAGLQKAGDDVVLVDGIKLTNEKLSIWRNELGYLPQDSFFIDGSIRENLIWDSGQNLSDEQILDVLKEVNADQIVLTQKLGLDTSIINYQYHFSGGERQRLALARVLIRKPKLLLLDEATSALDYETEMQIMDCLVRLKNDVTIVFVTHRQNLKQYFDKIIDLNCM
ncbi:MAG: ABC transporter ATP-binding protein [Bacteroidetes bacterium]|nr:ABC transporter ATP-binding protein [Bacteroidota bacterium]